MAESENISTTENEEFLNFSDKTNPLELEFQLTSQANNEYSVGSYDKCLETLEQLEICSGKSKKLDLNRAVVKFYKSKCRDFEDLLKNLSDLDENEQPRCRIATANLLIKYNRAVVYFHRHMPQTAINVLLPIAMKLDSLTKNHAILIGSLFLRLLLNTNQLRKAQAFLEILQNFLKIGSDSHVLDDGGSLTENLQVDEDLNRSYKLLAVLTNVMNRKVVVVPDDASPEFAALKALQYYIMKDFQMSAKQLKKISADNQQNGQPSNELSTCLANNMGVIHLRVRHYALAAKFFQYGLMFDKTISANLRQTDLHKMSAARAYEILYNLGISMLHLRRPKEAFQCFLKPLEIYHSNPRLWVRIAEACIMTHEMKVAKEEQKFLVTLINVAQSKKIPKPMHKMRNTPMYCPDSQSAAFPEPTLEFAALSLRNALTLTKYYRSNYRAPRPTEEDDSESGAPETQDWPSVHDNNFCNPSKPVTKESLDNLLSAIYAAYSYVCLRLGDYVIALDMAQELLKSEKLSDAHKMLGHMYAGEALIMMDKMMDANSHLDPKFVSSLNAFDFETKDWQVKSLDAAQNIVRYNLALAMVLQGEYDAAKGLMATCTHPIVTSKVLELKIYLDVCQQEKGILFGW